MGGKTSELWEVHFLDVNSQSWEKIPKYVREKTICNIINSQLWEIQNCEIKSQNYEIQTGQITIYINISNQKNCVA